MKADSRCPDPPDGRINGGDSTGATREERTMTTDLRQAAQAALIGELEGLRDGIRELAGPLNEEQFWAKPTDPGNSVGHLVLHLTGNLNHFVGGQLGGTGYLRDREREFTEQQVPAKAE